MKVPKYNIRGKVSEWLTVTDEYRDGRRWRYRCLCKCGNVITPERSHIWSGRVISCGCRKRIRTVIASPALIEDHISVEPNSGCWLWTGKVRCNGYGALYLEGKNILAHRFSYEQFVGAISDGLQIDHLCRTRSCVNPRHLEAVTCRDNLLRGQTLAAKNTIKVNCSRGHPFEGENLRIAKDGSRCCRSCDRENARANYHRRHPSAVFYRI